MARLVDVADLKIGINLSAGDADEMDIAVQVLDSRGAVKRGVFVLQFYVSSSEEGIGISGEDYTAALDADDGAILAVAGDGLFTVATNADGLFSAALEDDGTPSGVYVVVVNPFVPGVTVSEASGDNWGD